MECFTSDTVIDDGVALEEDETVLLEVIYVFPEDPRITVTNGNTTVIILDDDGKYKFRTGTMVSLHAPCTLSIYKPTHI